MEKIKLLPKKMVELIAAGEVVERPASVIKELVENAIDASAKNITVEIQNGGILYMRVTDNGSGIQKDDIRTAFMSHATSKISKAEDLYDIGTLGFRGEALAAISSVSKVELITRAASETVGTRYTIEGGVETLFEDIGCPRGTTFIIRDIFYNTPARMKFLKKDVSEANLISALMDRIAMSHPEISIKFIRDGKQTLITPGDGKLESAVYTVQGREFFNALVPVSGTGTGTDGISVSGFIGRPSAGKATRNGQFCYLNGRLVKSATVCAALEQAYKNSIMTGKFPVCVLNVNVPYNQVDVNVHPAKTEVRFSNEKAVFDSVYYAVKATLAQISERPEIELKKPSGGFEHMSAEQFRNQFAARGVFEGNGQITGLKSSGLFASTAATQAKIDIEYEQPPVAPAAAAAAVTAAEPTVFAFDEPASDTDETFSGKTVMYQTCEKEQHIKQAAVPEQYKEAENEELIFVGEAFRTYIVVQRGESLFIIDKHAAHERIIYDKLKAGATAEKQLLIEPQTVFLNKEEYITISEAGELLDEAGFEIEDLSDGMVMVRAVPASLCGDNISDILSQIADSLSKGGAAEPEKLDRMYHTVACRAAIKAGNRSGQRELLELARQVLAEGGVMYCPHGRPVAFEIKKHELEKQFGRLQ